MGSLTLLQLDGIGAKAVSGMIARYSTLGGVREAAERGDLSNLLNRVPPGLLLDLAWQDAANQAQEILEQANESGVQVLTPSAPHYPELLRLIPDCPPVLFAKGTLRDGRKNVACIGTRNPTSFGVHVTQRIVHMLAEHGWSIISGLALGVDAEAHRQALAANGHTVAILGSGLDRIDLRESQLLADEILDNGGAILSEQPFGKAATAKTLVQRNRLQSGMSVATVVLQTDIAGGSMHTARFTMMQGRQLVAAVPSGAESADPMNQGNLALTQKTGREHITLLKKISTEYADVLVKRFPNTPPAIPIHGQNDCERVLGILDACAGNHTCSCGQEAVSSIFPIRQECPADHTPHESFF